MELRFTHQSEVAMIPLSNPEAAELPAFQPASSLRLSLEPPNSVSCITCSSEDSSVPAWKHAPSGSRLEPPSFLCLILEPPKSISPSVKPPSYFSSLAP